MAERLTAEEFRQEIQNKFIGLKSDSPLSLWSKIKSARWAFESPKGDMFHVLFSNTEDNIWGAVQVRAFGYGSRNTDRSVGINLFPKGVGVNSGIGLHVLYQADADNNLKELEVSLNGGNENQQHTFFRINELTKKITLIAPPDWQGQRGTNTRTALISLSELDKIKQQLNGDHQELKIPNFELSETEIGLTVANFPFINETTQIILPRKVIYKG